MAVEKERSKSGAKASSLAIEFSKASQAAETIQQFADRSSVDKAGMAVKKEKRSSGVKAPSLSTENSEASTSHPRRPLTEEEKKHIQDIFRETVRLNTAITSQFVKETMQKDAKFAELAKV